MKVSIKSAEVKAAFNKHGIELAVYENARHLGDCIISNDKIIWREGQRLDNEKYLRWQDFIRIIKQEG
jgi:hypothetical protein